MSATSRSTRDGWWRTAPVLTIAVFALVISTAGGAYAVGKNSIGTKQLKKNAVTSSKIKSNAVQSSDVKDNTLTGSDVRDNSVTGADIADGSLTPGDFAPGQLAPLPAASSRIYFARVAGDGTLLARSSGVVSARRVSEGSYEVPVDFDAARCALIATASDTWRVVHTDLSGSNTVLVVSQRIGDDLGAPYANTGFSLTITC